MKKTFKLILSLLIAATFFPACTDKNDEPQLDFEILDAELQNQVILSNETSAKDVVFTTPGAWTSFIEERVTVNNPVQGTASWISITPDKGDAAGQHTVSISLEPNTANFSRLASITLMCNGKSIIIGITQKGIAKEKEEEEEEEEEEKREWERYVMRENLTTQELIEEMGLGINLGNTLEAGGEWINPNNILNYERAWGAPTTTEKIIAGYAKAGFSSIRIPVRWTNMMVGNTIHPSLLDRVQAIVNWTLDNGMIAMINSHHVDFLWDYDYLETRDEYREKFRAMWQQISERFKGYGDRLLFEPMNEIGFDRIWTPWSGGNSAKREAFGLVNELNQNFVDVVRASGGNNAKRHLVIEVYNTGLEYAYDVNYFKMPNDPAKRCAATVHYYTPACFAIAEGPTDWCPNGQPVTTWGTPAEVKELNDNMDRLKKNCVDKGIPIIVGEYAACGGNKTQEMRRLYAVSVTEAVYARGMCPMLWDTPGGQYNRSTCKFDDPIFIEQMMDIKVNHPR